MINVFFNIETLSDRRPAPSKQSNASTCHKRGCQRTDRRFKCTAVGKQGMYNIK